MIPADTLTEGYPLPGRLGFRGCTEGEPGVGMAATAGLTSKRGMRKQGDVDRK